ncbi:hypothetical protein [Rubrivirga sp. IMCC43871]|uniref:hypothetical protein n=1 Tax=Rubrivirga sp. IMCC43871 TaxID=3391575 RepID=UPI00398FE2A9
MRFSLALVVALVLGAAPALAQPVLSDSSTFYVSPLGSITHQSSQGTAFTAGGDIGWRLGSSSDVGLRLLTGDLTTRDGDGAFLTVGPTLGTSRRVVGGFELDARLLATATFSDIGPRGTADTFGLQVLRGTAQATVSRPIPIVGSLSLAPTLGLYGTSCATPGYEVAAGSQARCTKGGVLAGVDLRFRVFGADVSMPIIAPILSRGNDLAGQLTNWDVPTAPITGGVRISF